MGNESLDGTRCWEREREIEVKTGCLKTINAPVPWFQHSSRIPSLFLKASFFWSSVLTPSGNPEGKARKKFVKSDPLLS